MFLISTIYVIFWASIWIVCCFYVSYVSVLLRDEKAFEKVFGFGLLYFFLGINRIWHGNELELYGMVLTPNGSDMLDGFMQRRVTNVEEAENFGVELAELLLKNGAGRILAEIRRKAEESIRKTK